jgi:hypothetical protein
MARLRTARGKVRERRTPRTRASKLSAKAGSGPPWARDWPPMTAPCPSHRGLGSGDNHVVVPAPRSCAEQHGGTLVGLTARAQHGQGQTEVCASSLNPRASARAPVLVSMTVG